MNRGNRAFLLVAATIILVVGIRWLCRQVEIDRCLDAGKCWDTVKGACDFEGNEDCKPGAACAR